MMMMMIGHFSSLKGPRNSQKEREIDRVKLIRLLENRRKVLREEKRKKKDKTIDQWSILW
jgi:hypothetical protein